MIEPKFVGKIIEYLIEQDGEEEGFINLFLAAECLAEVRNRKVIASTADTLLNRLQNLAQEELQEKAALKLLTAIATTWKDNTKTLPWLKSCIRFDTNSYVPELAVQVIATNWKDKNCHQLEG
ncbi:MAG: hypothetical protein F6J89_10345 [Symploca sp. SIO1C4]|uniref:HEAT repeat domain-containing protein n=1 Tax=Symploca sp. SIO1C4 TaxID=2607765 RepID=A0A6B3ND36_9CYAN|nr:hypothetical protein [Symploca sp. SIO1C4]